MFDIIEFIEYIVNSGDDPRGHGARYADISHGVFVFN